MTRDGRRIDHVVLAVHDLDGTAELFAKMGFLVGARNRHPWGTENRLIQFHSSFIELITVGADRSIVPEHGERRFSFGAWVRDYLCEREGIAMVCLDSDDARRDARQFAERRIGDFEPFDFERKGRRPDGTETHVAFSLAFATDKTAPNLSFFVCQQHFPENFWNSAFQSHPNGATDISMISIAAQNPADHVDFLTRFTNSPAGLNGRQDIMFWLANRGRLEVREAHGETVAAIAIRLRDLSDISSILRLARFDVHAEKNRVWVDINGTRIIFETGEG